MPELEQKKLYFLLKSRAYTHPERSLEEFFVGMLPKRLGQCAMKAVALTPLSRQVSELADGDLQALAAQLKDWRLIVKDTNGLRNAQVTAGGASVTEFQSQTMESKLVSGLYACLLYTSCQRAWYSATCSSTTGGSSIGRLATRKSPSSSSIFVVYMLSL